MDELLPQFSTLLLIFVRLSTFFVTLPFFSYRTIPARHRLTLALILAWMMYYTFDLPPMEIDGHYYYLLIKEALVGLLIGFVANMIVSIIQIAGGFIDFQMGFAIANVIDPQTGVQSPLIGQYLYTFALLFLLSVNGHHLILDGIFYSYQFVPLSASFAGFGESSLAEFIIKTFSSLFVVAFQMAVPVVASLFLVDVALGITARTVPQLNVFVVGFPIKIGVSFIVLLIVMGIMMSLVRELFETMFYTMRTVMELIGGA
jgi:flagellar biosynthesis protein FliR